jgi:hypothetical protein
MCLSTITKRKPKSSGFGYKVFIISTRGDIRFLYQNGLSLKLLSLKLGVWMESSGGLIQYRWDWGDSNSNKFYPAGFHIFTNRKAADDLALMNFRRQVYRVQYSGAHTQGNNGGHTVVATRMKVLRQLKKKKK